MYVQRVDSEVIRVHVEVVENLSEGHPSPSLVHHHALRLCLIGFLDEGQQVLLRHAGSSMDVCVHLRE